MHITSRLITLNSSDYMIFNCVNFMSYCNAWDLYCKIVRLSSSMIISPFQINLKISCHSMYNVCIVFLVINVNHNGFVFWGTSYSTFVSVIFIMIILHVFCIYYTFFNLCIYISISIFF